MDPRAYVDVARPSRLSAASINTSINLRMPAWTSLFLASRAILRMTLLEQARVDLMNVSTAANHASTPWTVSAAVLAEGLALDVRLDCKVLR